MEEQKRPKLIGLCGRMGVGKDAAAALLSMIGYCRIAFADAVRLEIVESLSSGLVPVAALEDDRVAAVVRDLFKGGDTASIYAKPTAPSIRRILQWWGTEFRRKQNPDYWVDKVSAGLDTMTAPAVVSDVRFLNEVAAIRKRGGVIWRIERPAESNGIEGHVSETAVDDIKPDVVIDNSGTLIELAGKILFEIGNEKPKRGRPVGSRTKPKAEDERQVQAMNQAINAAPFPMCQGFNILPLTPGMTYGLKEITPLGAPIDSLDEAPERRYSAPTSLDNPPLDEAPIPLHPRDFGTDY